MPRTADDILADIEHFQPVDGFWRPLDVLLIELWSVGVPERAIPVLFAVFERYPDDDGAGVLYAIVHGVEHLDFDYEPALRASLKRQPSSVGQEMLGRLERFQARSHRSGPASRGGPAAT